MTEATARKIKLMPGTSGGKYFPFARKGNVLLGIKVEAIANGANFGVPDTTYFSLRLRSAPENGLFAEEDAAKKVVTLQPNPPNLWDAWPGVEWEKKDHERASTTIGVFFKGLFTGGGNEGRKLLLDAINEGKLATKLADYLISISGEYALLLPREDFIAYLDSIYAPTVASIVKKIEKDAAVAVEIESNIGNFATQAALLKNVYAKTEGSLIPASGDDAEADEGSEADETAEDDDTI